MLKNKSIAVIFFIILPITAYFLISKVCLANESVPTTDKQNEYDYRSPAGLQSGSDHLLSIQYLRNGSYPGSEITIEETLSAGSNYSKYIVSYESEGYKIYALLTVPDSKPPEGGFPAIIFNHGYIPPAQYKTTERYEAYVDGFAKNGYIVLKPDYRGHGNSEGEPEGAYGTNGYTIDVLNAVSSIKKHPNVNPEKIGMWGHSMGGFITLRSMVIRNDIKAGVIWAGVVGSYPDMINSWRRVTPPPDIPISMRRWREELQETFGTPDENPAFWNSISATGYLSEISGPISIHHGTADTSVPFEFSTKLKSLMDQANKEAELFIYEGDDHNLSKNFSIAMERSVEFFDKYLK